MKEIKEIKEYLWKHYVGKLCKVGFDIKLNVLIILTNSADWHSVETPPEHENDVIVWFSPTNKDIALYTEVGGKKKWLNTRSIEVLPKCWREFPQDPMEDKNEIKQTISNI